MASVFKHFKTASGWSLCLFTMMLAAGCASRQAAPQAAAGLEQPAREAGLAAAGDEAAVSTTKTKENKTVNVEIETSMGMIKAELYPEEAPKTVENFVTLAKKGFYENIIFHRVIPDFMIQTGDPTGTGMGGPGYSFEDEFSKKLRHDKAGLLSMANAGPNTNGSQFFITVAPTPWLDDRHSIFGRVTEGLEVAEKISLVERDRRDKPLQKVQINKITVLE